MGLSPASTIPRVSISSRGMRVDGQGEKTGMTKTTKIHHISQGIRTASCCGRITFYNIFTFLCYTPDSCCSISPQNAGWLVSVLGRKNLCLCLFHKLWGYRNLDSNISAFLSQHYNRDKQYFSKMFYLLLKYSLYSKVSDQSTLSTFLSASDELSLVWVPSVAPCVLHYYKPPAWKITFDTDNILRYADAKK